MRRRFIISSFLLLLCAFAALCGGCLSRNRPTETARERANSPHTEGKIRVVATIFPVSDIIRRVGGDSVQVETLLPPGASPHAFELGPTQVRELSQAELVVYIGKGVDDWAVRGSHNRRTLRLTDKTGVVNGDPHIWLDPVLVRDFIAPAVSEALVEIRPFCRPLVERNLQTFQGELSRLDEDVRQTLGGIPAKRFISLHSAWGYFARRYGLEEVGSIVEFPGEEPSAKWLRELVELARGRGAKVVFAEAQVSPKAASLMAQEIGGKVATLDPLGGPGVPGRGDYISLMEYNLESMRKAFER